MVIQQGPICFWVLIYEYCKQRKTGRLLMFEFDIYKDAAAWSLIILCLSFPSLHLTFQTLNHNHKLLTRYPWVPPRSRGRPHWRASRSPWVPPKLKLTPIRYYLESTISCIYLSQITQWNWCTPQSQHGLACAFHTHPPPCQIGQAPSQQQCCVG